MKALISMVLLFCLLLLGCSVEDSQEEEVARALALGKEVREATTQPEKTATIEEGEDTPSHACGDGQCEDEENSCTCPEDCGACEGEVGFCQVYACNTQQECSKQTTSPCCGDGRCERGEDIASCFQDCSEPGEKTLSDWPHLADRIIPVVGEQAPSQDVVTATALVPVLQSNQVLVGEAKLSNEIVLYLDDFLVIGSPCDNPIAAELLRNEIIKNSQNCDIFKYGEGLIRLYQTSPNTVALLVSGKTSEETSKAARVLTQFQEKLQGRSVRVTGSKQSPEVTAE